MIEAISVDTPDSADSQGRKLSLMASSVAEQLFVQASVLFTLADVIGKILAVFSLTEVQKYCANMMMKMLGLCPVHVPRAVFSF